MDSFGVRLGEPWAGRLGLPVGMVGDCSVCDSLVYYNLSPAQVHNRSMAHSFSLLGH